MNGYSLLDKIFNNMRDYQQQNESRFMDNMFELLQLIIINDSQTGYASNLDALEFLIKLVSHSKLY